VLVTACFRKLPCLEGEIPVSLVDLSIEGNFKVLALVSILSMIERSNRAGNYLE